MIILVPLDQSPHALAALPVAQQLAHLYGATLHVLHVTPRRIVPPAHLLELLGLDAAQLQGSVLDGRAGDPAEGILRAATEDPEMLIVMCTNTGHAVHRLLGHTAEQVLLGAHCPVVLVPPELGAARWKLRKVMLAHDGTPTTSAAIRPGAALATLAEALLLVVHVAAPGAAAPTEPGSLPSPRYLDHWYLEWPSWASEFLERLTCLSPFDPAHLRLLVGHGEPGLEVVRFARQAEADLIVLAWHGALETPHARVVRTVLLDAPCPVMVLRAGP